MNITEPGPPIDDTPDPKQIAFEKWMYSDTNQDRAVEYLRSQRIVPERVALEPSPRYNRVTKRLTVEMFILDDKGIRSVTPEGSKRVKATFKVSAPPPWVR